MVSGITKSGNLNWSSIIVSFPASVSLPGTARYDLLGWSSSFDDAIILSNPLLTPSCEVDLITLLRIKLIILFIFIPLSELKFKINRKHTCSLYLNFVLFPCVLGFNS